MRVNARALAAALSLLCADGAWPQSDDAKRYIEVRKQYEPFRCQQVRLMRAQGDAANGQDMDKARALFEERAALLASAEVRELEMQMLELRSRIMSERKQEDYEAIGAAEGEIRRTCQ